MSRLSVIILLLAVFLAADFTVSCGKKGELELSTNSTATFSLSFSSVAPVGTAQVSGWMKPNASTTTVWNIDFINASRAYLFAPAQSAQWDKDLAYELYVEYFQPGKWKLDLYKCNYTYSIAGEVFTWSDYSYVVMSTPPRATATITFVVPRDRASWSGQKTLDISIPIHRANLPWPVCSSLSSNGVCNYFNTENLVRWLSYPNQWIALQVNGYKAGGVAQGNGVNATIPNPWFYSHCSDVGCIGSLVTDLAQKSILDSNVPFLHRVGVNVMGQPIEWGYVELRPPRAIPLYFSRVVATNSVDCGPPNCFVVDSAGNSTWAGTHWVWNTTLSAVAFKTDFVLTPYVALDSYDGRFISRNIVIYMPLGSVANLKARVYWLLDIGSRRLWVGSRGTMLRVVDDGGNLLDYETWGAKGKLAYSLNDGQFAVAVDKSNKHITTAWYSPPDPCSQRPTRILPCTRFQHVFTKVKGEWVGYAMVGGGKSQWSLNILYLVDWLVGKPYYFRDLLGYLGDPVIYNWHYYRIRAWAFNPATGDFDISDEIDVPPPHPVSLVDAVYSVADFRNTTKAPSYHEERLYYVSTGPASFYNYVYEGVYGDEHPAGWTDALPLGIASMVTNSTSPWAVFLVPATACNDVICVKYSPTLWGPAPGPTADLALPGAGYSFLLTYLGRPKNTTIRIYVERGYVVDGANWRPVKNFPVAEMTRVWRPFDAVYVGPGWWLDYKPLGACQSMPLGARPIYVTPNDYVGPLLLTIEDGGKKYYFAFFISNDVSYEINTYSLAPNLFESPYLNATVRLTLNGVPYFHGLNLFGEGGRLEKFRCEAVQINAGEKTYIGNGMTGDAAQLVASGDFWSRLGLSGMSVEINTAVARPRFEVVDWNESLVKISADGPVVGFALYLKRGGSWQKIDEIRGSCLIVNASLIFPWDPVLVLPIVKQNAMARPGETTTLWRPSPRLLFKTWADRFGYRPGLDSTPKIVGVCTP